MSRTREKLRRLRSTTSRRSRLMSSRRTWSRRSLHARVSPPIRIIACCRCSVVGDLFVWGGLFTSPDRVAGDGVIVPSDPVWIRCNEKEGIFYFDINAVWYPPTGGSEKGEWFTPSHFEAFAGRHSSKKWKASLVVLSDMRKMEAVYDMKTRDNTTKLEDGRPDPPNPPPRPNIPPAVSHPASAAIPLAVTPQRVIAGKTSAVNNNKAAFASPTLPVAKLAVVKPPSTKEVIDKPSAAKEVIDKPSAAKVAVVDKPAAAKPSAAKVAVVDKPSAAKPAAAKVAVVDKPSAAKVAVVKSPSAKEAVDRPSAAKPPSAKSAVAKPAVAKPAAKPAARPSSEMAANLELEDVRQSKKRQALAMPGQPDRPMPRFDQPTENDVGRIGSNIMKVSEQMNLLCGISLGIAKVMVPFLDANE